MQVLFLFYFLASYGQKVVFWLVRLGTYAATEAPLCGCLRIRSPCFDSIRQSIGDFTPGAVREHSITHLILRTSYLYCQWSKTRLSSRLHSGSAHVTLGWVVFNFLSYLFSFHAYYITDLSYTSQNDTSDKSQQSARPKYRGKDTISRTLETPVKYPRNRSNPSPKPP